MLFQVDNVLTLAYTSLVLITKEDGQCYEHLGSIFIGRLHNALKVADIEKCLMCIL